MASPHRLQAALRAAVVPFPGQRASGRLDLGRLLPSGRSLVLGFALVAAGVLAYVGARSTAVFAVRHVDVRGVSGADAAAVRQALAPLVGESLVSLERERIQRRLADLPGVRTFTYDRAFPNTLELVVVPEIPVAVLRRGKESWLVSRRGRVLRRAVRGESPSLPRIWLPRGAGLVPGATLPDGRGGVAARSLALLASLGFPDAARTVRTDRELTYVLRSGLELRLGDARDAGLKLAVAARILPRLEPEILYLDLSVPERPVAGTTLNSKPEVEG